MKKVVFASMLCLGAMACGVEQEEATEASDVGTDVASLSEKGGDESAAYFRWQCGANTASLRDSPGGTLAQIGYGEGVDVLGGDGGAWWYVRRLATGQLGWMLKQYYCQ